MLLDWLTQRVFDRAHRDHDGAPFEIVKLDGERLTQSRLGFDEKFMRKWQFDLAMSTVPADR